MGQVPHWFQERPSDYPWEQQGLDFIKQQMPVAEPFRAWATFSFTAASGRVHECDLLIAVPGGLYLLELKGHPGTLVNTGENWKFRVPDSSRVLNLRNPLHAIDAKSKDLRSRLEWAARRKNYKGAVPRIEPAVFLSAQGLDSHLDAVQQTGVYGRDGASTGLKFIWRDLLSRPPQRANQRIDGTFSSKILPSLLAEVGIRVSLAHLRFGDDWTLEPKPMDAGPMWEDRFAKRRGPVRKSGRVRIYLTEQQSGEERRQAVDRAARREYQVLQGRPDHRARREGAGRRPGDRADDRAPGRTGDHRQGSGPEVVDVGRLSGQRHARRRAVGPVRRHDRALEGLKFSEALPPRLAVATLAARLADLDGAAMVLAESTRFVRARN